MIAVASFTIAVNMLILVSGTLLKIARKYKVKFMMNKRRFQQFLKKTVETKKNKPDNEASTVSHKKNEEPKAQSLNSLRKEQEN